MGRAAGTLGSAPAAAAKGAVMAEGPATIEELAAAEEPVVEGPAVEGPEAGGVGPWRTYGLKEWAHLVFAIFGPEGKQLERRWVFQKLVG